MYVCMREPTTITMHAYVSTGNGFFTERDYKNYNII